MCKKNDKYEVWGRLGYILYHNFIETGKLKGIEKKITKNDPKNLFL